MDHLIKSFGADAGGLMPILAVASLVVAIASGSLSIAFWVLLRRRVIKLELMFSRRQRATANLQADSEAQASVTRKISVEIEELRTRMMDREHTLPNDCGGWPGAGLPLNLNRRGQILRLNRKGKSAAEIASDLKVAQGEVELLLKVCDLSTTAPDPSASE